MLTGLVLPIMSYCQGFCVSIECVYWYSTSQAVGEGGHPPAYRTLGSISRCLLCTSISVKFSANSFVVFWLPQSTYTSLPHIHVRMWCPSAAAFFLCIWFVLLTFSAYLFFEVITEFWKVFLLLRSRISFVLAVSIFSSKRGCVAPSVSLSVSFKFVYLLVNRPHPPLISY